MDVHFLIILKYRSAGQLGVSQVDKKVVAFFINIGQYVFSIITSVLQKGVN